MFRAFVFGVLVTIVIALVGGYFILRNGIIPANADATPGWLETWAAETSLDATLSREAQGTNPVSMTDDRRGGGRSRRLLLLEDQAWHPVDRDAVMEGDAHRPADLEPCSVPQAYG